MFGRYGVGATRRVPLTQYDRFERCPRYPQPTGDLLTVFAEAFDRDADPDDFSLLAMIAHERGHQLLARHPRLSPRMVGVSPAAEEVLASLLGHWFWTRARIGTH